MKIEVSAPYSSTEVFEDEYDAARYITELDTYIDNMEVDIDDNIDESYGRIEIAGIDFWASRILRELDETAYDEIYEEEKRNCAENDADWLAGEIRQMSDGDERDFNGVTVRCYEEDEEEDEVDEDQKIDSDFSSIFD